ncbi:50S ribosomal protein L25/general stress protein Ctc [Aliikangiella marina]|uniref:Large ribosomal subunit protein bL25 n=1 Tax=Aliikangiella marina TaxID=1712262 RepID=A0A545TGW3_9GAMM|nr:50S ribosomal protein L25/general stress protein Ctc [Aliikangiella marina]TQV76469.1 50S ribosomal protein L25/general stress protein Ctc [Aliikangiella marina]
MSDSFELNVELREDMGKGASRRLRRLEDKIPGIVYGGGREPQPITISHPEIIKHLEDEAFYSHILTLKAGKKTEKVILKDLQRHPYKPKVTHADFMRVKAGEKLTTSVPLHYLNEEKCPGVKAGGVVSHAYTTLEISCLPKDLPEFIEVDLADLEMDQVVHLSDIKLPKGVEIVELTHGEDHDHAIVTIHKSRSAASTGSDEEGDAAEDSAE